MSRSEIWWSSMAVTTQPQPTDTLKITWVDDPPGEIDLNLYDGKVGKILELNAVFADFELAGARYLLKSVTRKTPLTHVVEFSEVTLVLEPVAYVG